MIVWRDGDYVELDERRSAVAVGVFDGLHRGHQRVIGRARELAAVHAGRLAVVTFFPHPALTVHPERVPLAIGTLEQRLHGFEALGVELVRVLHFDEQLALESAESFVDRVLVHDLRAADVVVGEDFRYGHDRAGDVRSLSAVGANEDFRVHALALAGDGRRWSSTAIRDAVSDGHLERAATVLGRPFALRAVVEHGDARGRELGFPTANLRVDGGALSPPAGVYAAAVRTPEGEWWCGAVSIGRRPQFYDEGETLVEVHLVDYHGDLYGATIDVAFLKRLRDQVRFDSVEDLVAQMGRDVAECREIYTSSPPTTWTLLG